jgi:hypothetical protein
VRVVSAEQLQHGLDCECTRCRGFEPGNKLRFREGNGAAVRHGAYATLRLGARAAEIEDELRPLVPGGDPVDAPAVSVLAMVLARLERAMLALDQVDDTMERPLSQYVGAKGDTLDQLSRLRQDARGWANVALRGLDALALVPTSRGRLGLDVARIRQLDLSRLSDRQLDELAALVEEAELDA